MGKAILKFLVIMFIFATIQVAWEGALSGRVFDVKNYGTLQKTILIIYWIIAISTSSLSAITKWTSNDIK